MTGQVGATYYAQHPLHDSLQELCAAGLAKRPTKCMLLPPKLPKDAKSYTVNPVTLQELGAAGLTKRPTSCMLLLPKPPKGGAEGEDGKEFAESFADVHRRVKAVQPSVF